LVFVPNYEQFAGIDDKAIEIKDTDFVTGSLRQKSFARPDKIFTGHEVLINRRVGVLSADATSRLIEVVVSILRQK